MKKMSKLLCAALVLCMVIGLVPAIALADEEKPVYVVLGDSVAAAYGLGSYVTNAGGDGIIKDYMLADGSYADLIGEKLGAEVKLHAHSGWRTDEFLRVVNNDTECWKDGAKFLSDFLLTGLSTVAGTNFNNHIVVDVQGIPNDLKNADVVTVCFGSNDIFTYGLTNLIFSKMDGMSTSAFADLFNFDALNIANIKSLADLKAFFDNLIKTVSDVIGGLEFFAAKCEEGLANYKNNLPDVLKYITEASPNAKIYMQNVCSPVNLGIGPIELHTSVDGLVKEANAFLMEQCAQYDNVYYVDVSDAEYYGLESLNLNDLGGGDAWKTLLKLLKIVHPSEKGHATIAKDFIAAMDRAEKAPEIKVGVNPFKSVTVSWNAVKGAPYYQVYRAEGDGAYKLVAATMAHRWVDIEASGNEGDYHYKVVASTDMAGVNKTSFSNVEDYTVVDVGFSAGIMARMLRNLTAAITLPCRITEALTKTISNIIG